MPFTLFCHLKTPKEAFEFLEGQSAATNTEGDSWSAKFVFPGGIFKKNREITINFDRDWCSPPNWPQQIAGMQNFVANWRADKTTQEQVMLLIRRFAFCLGVIDEPEIKKGDDPRLEIMHRLAGHLGGVIFTPGALLDSQFRPFYAVDGQVDPDATFPNLPEIRVEIPDGLLDEVKNGEIDAQDDPLDDHADEEPEPPSAHRVAKRLYVNTAVVARGLLDMNLEMGNRPAYSLGELHDWLEHLDVTDEIERHEANILSTTAGHLVQQDTLKSVWTLEGLVVLAWALGLSELPKYDELVDTDQLLKRLSFLDPGACRQNLEQASLRPLKELVEYNNQIFALNWRMVDFRVRPRAVDYANVVIAGRLFDLSWATIKNGDLVLQGGPISEADPDLLQMINSLAVERHKASNWLLGFAHLYSHVSTDT